MKTRSESIRCPKSWCRSSHTVWIGFFPTKRDGLKHRRKCQRCGSSWYPRPNKEVGEECREFGGA